MFYFIFVYFILLLLLLLLLYFITIMDRVMLQAAVRQPLPKEILFSLGPILVGIVVYRLVLGQA